MEDDRSEENLASGLGAGPDVVLLAGPTASGKSALAVQLARALGGEVLNADSMQVYSVLHILSARPAKAEMGDIPHHLFGHVPGEDQYDTARWLSEVSSLIALRQGPLIIVGGTGLYFSSLEKGLSELPTISQIVRDSVRHRFENSDSSTLHAELAAVDATAAQRIEPGDGQRVQRALEVFEATGRSLFDQPQPAPETLPLHGLSVRRIILEPARDVLHQRIARRFDAMVAEGALDEVRALLKLQLPADRTVLKAIGVPEFSAFLDGRLTLDQAVADAKTATRRYAKRQSTWFRNQMDESWERVTSSDELALAQ
ncbi:MAG: tRNA (adenosine(37)-N6)-dimethylallyltransferase MiaA [Pseudomonadota bacterium]